MQTKLPAKENKKIKKRNKHRIIVPKEFLKERINVIKFLDSSFKIIGGSSSHDVFENSVISMN